MNSDIVIVGGGMVGACMALELAVSFEKLGIDDLGITLVDAGAKPGKIAKPGKGTGAFDSRVSALSIASQQMFANLGIWEPGIADRACPYTDMRVWEEDGTASIHFSATDLHRDQLGYIVENRVIQAALGNALEQTSLVRVLEGKAVTGLEPVENDDGFGHELEINGEKALKCKLLIGADGGQSRIRQLKDFSIREWEYGHTAIVATVQTALAHRYTAYQRFMQSGPLAFLPLLNLDTRSGDLQNFSSIVWSCEPPRAEQLLTLDDEDFGKVLEKAFEGKLGKIEHSGPRLSFPLVQRHARDYVKNGVALVGDAAHSIHPLAGQGVNLGFLDVLALNQVILEALDKGEDYSSEQVLSRYQRKRKGGNLGMMAMMEGFKRLFASDDPGLRWLRNVGVSGVDRMASAKQVLMRKAMGI